MNILKWFFAFCGIALYGELPQKVVICGICKDIEEHFLMNKAIMEEIGGLFSDYRIIVYENNSKDKSAICLQTWASENTKVAVYSEVLEDSYWDQFVINKTVHGRWFRPEMIARARNIVLDHALGETYEEFPYIIWVDMDFAIFPKLDGLVEIFQTDREWDAIFAYGVAKTGEYWDWYAMRYEMFPFGPELLGEEWYKMGARREGSVSLNSASDWFPVYSAFGGCGIYKKSSIEGCRYAAIVTKDLETVTRKLIDRGVQQGHLQALRYQEKLKELTRYVHVRSYSGKEIRNSKTGIILFDVDRPVIWRMNTFTYAYPSVCEHVPFHASMIARGHDKLFIHPRLVFTYGAFE